MFVSTDGRLSTRAVVAVFRKRTSNVEVRRGLRLTARRRTVSAGESYGVRLSDCRRRYNVLTKGIHERMSRAPAGAMSGCNNRQPE